jgi:ATP-dependent Clp protease adaptor protein ClpS
MATKTTTTTSNDSEVAVIERTVVAPPHKWNVILHNDEKTTMEFVVMVLMQIFHKSFEDAQECMMSIHETGKGIAGTYSHEIAVAKRDEATAAARANGFPLVVEIEQA